MRMMTALTMALMLALVCGMVAAEEAISVYIAPDSLTKEASLALVQRLAQAMPAAVDDGDSTLWQRVMAGDAPQLAICTAQEAARYAGEGLLLPLDMEAEDAERIAEAVLSACTLDGELFIAPLYARHRRMAVNRRLMEKLQVAALMDERVFPVWQPMQLVQVMEEAALSGMYAFEVWPCGEDGGALLALIQALYGGAFVTEEGVQADNDAAVMALEWLCDAADAEMIGMVGSREEALRHFLDGETVLFIDWSDEDAQRYAASGEEKMTFVRMPYPSSLGLPVRDMQVTGIAAFRTGDVQRDAQLAKAAQLLARDDQVRRVLGERGIEADDAFWLASPGESGVSALRALTGAAVDAVLSGEMEAEAALRLAQAAYEGGR